MTLAQILCHIESPSRAGSCTSAIQRSPRALCACLVSSLLAGLDGRGATQDCGIFLLGAREPCLLCVLEVFELIGVHLTSVIYRGASTRRINKILLRFVVTARGFRISFPLILRLGTIVAWRRLLLCS